MRPESPSVSEESAYRIREYLSILRRKKWSILLVTAVAVGAALALTLRQTKVYSSTAEVVLHPPLTLQGQSSGPIQTQVDPDTESKVVHSTAVAALVKKAIDFKGSARELLSDLSVSASGQTAVLDITYTDPRPAVAKTVAQAFADQYLKYKKVRALKIFEASQETVQAQIDDLQKKLEAADKQVANAPSGSVEQQEGISQHNILTAQIALLQNQLVPLSKAIVDPGAVIQRAELPRSPSSPKYVLSVAAALFVGLVVAIGIAILRERLDDRLAGANDLEERLRAPVLAVVPRVRSWRRRAAVKLIMVESPRGGTAEAYRGLRLSVEFMARNPGFKSFLVTSPLVGEGKTTTTANLGVALARAHKRVIVVSADLRKPRIHQFFGSENERGIVDVLLGEVPLSEALMDTSVENVRLLNSGPLPGNPTELLQSEPMQSVMTELSRQADFVLVDSPPALPIADSFALAQVVDAVILVADSRSTTRTAVVHAKQKLEQVGGLLLGTVLNDYDPKRSRAYETYRYGYGYRGYGSGDVVVSDNGQGDSAEEGSSLSPSVTEDS